MIPSGSPTILQSAINITMADGPFCANSTLSVKVLAGNVPPRTTSSFSYLTQCSRQFPTLLHHLTALPRSRSLFLLTGPPSSRSTCLPWNCYLPATSLLMYVFLVVSLSPASSLTALSAICRYRRPFTPQVRLTDPTEPSHNVQKKLKIEVRLPLRLSLILTG